MLYTILLVKYKLLILIFLENINKIKILKIYFTLLKHWLHVKTRTCWINNAERKGKHVREDGNKEPNEGAMNKARV